MSWPSICGRRQYTGVSMPVCLVKPQTDEIRRLCVLDTLNLRGRRLERKSVCAFPWGKRKFEKQQVKPGGVVEGPAEAKAAIVLKFWQRRGICWAKTGALVNVNAGIRPGLPFFCSHFRGLSLLHPYAQSAAAHTASPPTMQTANTAPAGTAPTGAAAIGRASSGESDPLVQYVVVRQDLTAALQWPLGAVVAQACHAAVDALGLAMEQSGEDARRYLAEGSNMRTVVLQVSDESELLKLRNKLVQNQISHKLWQEEPEKIPTALASVPIRKSAGRVFKGLKLLS